MDRVIGERYRLLSPLGTGGMGTVWHARDELLHRDGAVKEVVLPAGLPAEDAEQLRERTRREGRAAAKLDSPHAVTVYDVVEQDGHPYLVMELVQASTLSHVVKREGPLAPDRVARIGLDVLSALEAAHHEGIVHRDVKPSNVLVCPDGRVVLSDFGIAHSTGEASLTSTGLLLGSPAYIAPERARGEVPGPASDLWSLGATLYTAVEGRPPFDTGDPLTTLTAVVAGDPAPCVLAGPLAPVLEGLLARDPADRLDAAGARAALTAVATSGPQPTLALPLPTAPVERADRTVAVPPLRRARSPVVGVAAVALLVGAAATTGYLLSDRGAGSPSGRAAGAPSAAAVPASWQTYTGDGWSVRVPPGWQQSTYRGQVQFKDPVTRRTVRVGPASLGSSALQALTATAGSFASSHAGYQQLRLQAEGSGAVWEMTYSDGGADLHAADHALLLGGRGFTVFTQSKQADWGAARADLERVVASLRTA
jgi:hypothetical protein